MSATTIAPETPAVRCKIDEVFARPFIELIGLAPRNPVVRGLILAQTRKLPGPDCETFEQIKVWVETTLDPRAGGGHLAKAAGLAGDGFTVKVEFSETECGRAHYSVGRSGTDEFALDADEVIDLVQKAIDNEAWIDGVVDKLSELIEDNAWDRCEPNLDDYGDYEYDDHETSDSGNAVVEFSRTQVRDRLLGFLRERHPDLLEELI